LADFSRLFFEGLTDLKISDYYKIMELSTSSQVGDFISDFKKFIDSLNRGKNTKQVPSGKKAVSINNNVPKVMIIGNLITEEKLWDMLSSIDLQLVSDDLCISSRYYTGLVENGSQDQVDGRYGSQSSRN
jgi:benzoyl-CoA reductase/2-hydroxyglutaryl-CoA dehydratase subunit BcrC/BadD/HgdB